MRFLGLLTVAAILISSLSAGAVSAKEDRAAGRRGVVRVDDHALKDRDGHFLGLGVSYFTALWRCKHDRPRLESDLAFLSGQGFNYFRMLAMVGHHPGWEGREIAPVGFANRDGKRVEAWDDYWSQLRALVDLAYDRYGMRTQITIFADAQLMPDRDARVKHMQRMLDDVVRGREHKIILLEVANEAWQNGFPEEEGVAQLREFANFLNDRTEVPIAITSNHDWPELGSNKGFEQVYADSAADIATWHFSRDRGPDDGWKPVDDCWEFGVRPKCPPASSNEPIGPGSSVNTEKEPVRLVMAAAFAYAAKLPMYVFHSRAGVGGEVRFEDTPGIDRFGHVLKLLPGDLSNWERYDGVEEKSPLTVFAGGGTDNDAANKYVGEDDGAVMGCVRNIGGRKGKEFVCVPIGIRKGGVMMEAREAVEFTAYDPLTGKAVHEATLRRGERATLPVGPGALIVKGKIAADDNNRR